MSKLALLVLSFTLLVHVFIVSVSGMTRIGRSVTSYTRDRPFFKPQEMRNLRAMYWTTGDFGPEEYDVGNSHDYNTKQHGRRIRKFGAFPVVMVTRQRRIMALKLRQKENRNNFDADDAKAL